MKPQKNIFTEGEADAWLERNRDGLEQFDADHDPVIRYLRPHLRPSMAVAEVGCSLAGRVAALAAISGATGFGIDPSKQAISDASRIYPQLHLSTATADLLPWGDQSIDVLVYGFCLYLCDRSDLFLIAAEGDRVLKEGGFLAVLDFNPPFPYRNQYSHKSGLFSYKMDNARLWSWNPSYVEIAREVFDHTAGCVPGVSGFLPDERVAVTVLRKMPAHAYPNTPAYPSA